MDSDTAVVTAQERPPAEFLALSPYEVEQSRAGMREWAKSKTAEMKGQRLELEATLDTAAKHGWPMQAFERQLGLAKRREEFYRKIEAALAEGYLVVPNFPMTVFAVRTKRANPDFGAHQGWGESAVPDVKAQLLPAGDGRYVSARPEIEREDIKDEKGIERHYYSATALNDDPVATFPMVLAKPRIIEATQRAIAEHLFDEMGVADGTLSPGVRADPIILGRILNPRRQAQPVTFFIAWTADLSKV